jgi:2-methylcitrate dehydratase PrpD
LAQTLTSTNFADFPAGVVVDARRAILDWLGCALSGALEPPAQKTHCVVKRFGTSNDATVFAAGRSSAAAAALANGVASHILELDDVHRGSTLHPAAAVIPAALAVAERERASGPDFLRAVVLGYEAATRIGEAVNPSHYRYWHPTGTAATFGAAAAAAAIMRLDAEQLADALGTAGTQAAGLWEFKADGAMSKPLHSGKAASNGILAADLAREGFTGAKRILEGDRGFFRATSESHDGSRVTDQLGDEWKIAETCYKVHSCCAHTHTAVDVALSLRSSANSGIDEIRIETYGPGNAIAGETNPRTAYLAQFSISYCVAAALLEGRVGLAQFVPERFGPAGVGHPPIAALLSRTRVTVADDLTARYPGAWPTRVEIALSDGSVLRGASDYPRGNPENPVSMRELEDKFRELVVPRFGASVADRAIAAVASLESCDDMAEVFRDLAP